jgi:hypothetical protein
MIEAANPQTAAARNAEWFEFVCSFGFIIWL